MEEIVSKLGIDVKLLLAQVVNFFILFFILLKLVYKPILNLLEKRKSMIEKTVSDSKKIEERLSALESEKGKILSDASNEAMRVLETSRKQSQEENAKMIEEAKEEIAQAYEKHKEHLKSDKEALLRQIKSEVSELVILSSEKLIKKNFSSDDQKRLKEAIENEITTVKS